MISNLKNFGLYRPSFGNSNNLNDLEEELGRLERNSYNRAVRYNAGEMSHRLHTLGEEIEKVKRNFSYEEVGYELKQRLNSLEGEFGRFKRTFLQKRSRW